MTRSMLISNRMKDDAMWKEHHELEKASKSHKRNDSNHLNDILNKHTESISNYDIIEKSNERERE